MARSPAISILLPAHDAVSTLGAALASVARQRERSWQCVVVDDGSRDETAAVAQAWVRQDGRFSLMRLPHGGIVEALLAGLGRCEAPLVARMDADDLMHRDRLALQRRALDADPTLAAVGSRVRLFPRADLRPGRLAYEGWLNAIGSAESLAREAYVECPLAHPTLMVRRDVLDANPYRDAGWPEDYDLVLRLLGAGHRLAVVPRRLLFWRDGPARLSRTHPRYALDRFTACKAHHLARTFLAASPRYALWGYGGTGKALRRALAAHDRAPCAIVELDPRRLGQRIHGAPVVSPAELPRLRGTPLLVSVAGLVARSQIRAQLAAFGYHEGADFVVCA